jgi:hypothetical protein
MAVSSVGHWVAQLSSVASPARSKPTAELASVSSGGRHRRAEKESLRAGGWSKKQRAEESSMPLKRPQDIRGHNSVEVTQLYIWQDEAGTNGSDSLFELFTEID